MSDLGYCCDDYHRLIANTAILHSGYLGRPIDYVEIGTFTGNSAAAVLGTGKIRRAVLIDNFCLDFKGVRQSKQMVEERLKQYNGCFEVMEGDSRVIARDLKETFDIGFVDGDHSEESCRIDMTNMLPLLAPNGIMFVHDVGNCHKSWTYLLPVVAQFARDNNLAMTLHDVSDGLAELIKKT